MKYKLKTADFNLFLLPSDTEMTEFIEEVWNLGELFPEIYKRISEEQDVLAKGKKDIRLLDRRHMHEKTSDIPGLRLATGDCDHPAASLGQGRPRMSPELVFLFSRLRGYWGSVSDHDAYERMRDSMTLHVLFMNIGICLPGMTTILENINCVSTSTHDFIFECQLSHILNERLDDFQDVQLDSTSVKASSSWPTDAGVIFKLLNRVHVCGKKLNRFGAEPFKDFYMPTWQKELKALLFEINNTGSKKEKKLRSLYSLYLKTAHKALEYLTRMLERRLPEVEKTDRFPSVRIALKEILGLMEDDLLALSAVLYYSEEHIFNGVVLPSSLKILSISDSSAAFIKKGQREAVIGYKPQLCRSVKGFVTALILEKGNISDSENLVPLVVQHKANTGVTPKSVSTDSGYASKKGYLDCKGLGVEDVCIGGSKGKALLPEDLWLSEKYVSGRRMRSAVESLMFTLKYVFEFGLPRRRGLENVRNEMIEKITAYNFVKMLRMKRERRNAEESLFEKTA
jgi:hypothetical protein